MRFYFKVTIPRISAGDPRINRIVTYADGATRADAQTVLADLYKYLFPKARAPFDFSSATHEEFVEYQEKVTIRFYKSTGCTIKPKKKPKKKSPRVTRLTDDEALQVIYDLRSMPAKEVAKKHKLPDATVTRIERGMIYKHLPR